MLKTADLNRSKKLKSLGWEQKSAFAWMECNGDISLQYCPIKHWSDGNRNINPYVEVCRTFTAGEMIEWLVKNNPCQIHISILCVSVKHISSEGVETFESGLTANGLENALADACAWVLERKK